MAANIKFHSSQCCADADAQHKRSNIQVNLGIYLSGLRKSDLNDWYWKNQ
jgi:hypothetical protein